MFNAIRELVEETNDEANENLKNTLKEVTEAMVLLATLVGSERNTGVPWVLLNSLSKLAEKAHKLYEVTK